MYDNITGVILAGGKSSRMEINKSFLKLGNQTIIEKIVNLMKSLFKKVIIITNSPEEYRFLQSPFYEDVYKWKGPLSGIHSALIHSTTEKVFVISCDVPLMSAEMIKYIVDYKSSKPVKFCEAAGYYQTLVRVYSKSLITEIEKVIGNEQIKDRSIHQFLKNIDAEIIHPQELSFYKDEVFYNVNKPEDYEMVLVNFEKKVNMQ